MRLRVSGNVSAVDIMMAMQSSRSSAVRGRIATLYRGVPLISQTPKRLRDACAPETLESAEAILSAEYFGSLVLMIRFIPSFAFSRLGMALRIVIGFGFANLKT